MPSDPKEDDQTPIPLSFWFLTGGTGPPPTISAFQQMALERKAAHREAVSFRQARKDAIAKLERDYGSLGLTGLIKEALELGKRKKPDRKQLMATFGGREKAVGRWRRDIGAATGGGCVPAVASPPVSDGPPPDVPVDSEADKQAADEVNGSENEHNSATGNETPGNEAPGNEAPGNEAPGNEAPGDDHPDPAGGDEAGE